MIRWFVLSLIAISCTYNAKAGSYYASDLWSDISCFISVDQEKGLYSMELSEQATDDLVLSTIYSSGRLETNGRFIYFYDTLYGLKMVAKVSVNNRSMNFISGFDFMLNREFELGEQEVELGYETTHLIYENNVVQYFRDIDTSIVTGRYSDRRNNMSLHLERDGTFSYFLAGLSMLKGVWIQNENLIILKDEKLAYDFYLIYEEPNLRTMLLPGDTNLEGTVLTPQ